MIKQYCKEKKKKKENRYEGLHARSESFWRHHHKEAPSFPDINLGLHDERLADISNVLG